MNSAKSDFPNESGALETSVNPLTRAAGCEVSELNAGLGDHAPRLDGLGQRVVIGLVLIRVRPGELEDRAIEAAAAAEIGRDRDPVPAAGVRPRQRPATQPAVRGHSLGHHLLDLSRSLPVLELAAVEVAGDAVQPGLDVDPAE